MEGYGARYLDDADPLRCLEHVMSARNSSGSIMKNYARDMPGSSHFEVYNRHPQWLVVMYVVVIHAPPRIIAASGLFGLLGDAPIQIIDLADDDRIEAMFEFVERWSELTQGPGEQGGIRCSRSRQEAYLKELMIPSGDSDVASNATDIRPAVMFGVCHQNCSPSDLPPHVMAYLRRHN